MIAELREGKPVLKILAKSDLADPVLTKEWMQELNSRGGITARTATTNDPGRIKQLNQVCMDLFPNRSVDAKAITSMIVGVPNVGKSTLINILAGKKIAKTGNEPAVTKSQQTINIGNHISLMDTPGMLWPNVANRNSGFRLAAVGSVKDTAMDYGDVAFFAVKHLLKQYPSGLKERYGLDSVPDDAIEFLETVGRKRGCLGRSNSVDYDRVSRILLTEFRSGKLGKITLETPAMIEAEILEMAAKSQSPKNTTNKSNSKTRKNRK